MKDRVNQDIGTKGLRLDWDDIDWQLIEKRIKNLRQRIFRATKCGKWNQVRSLIKLMLRSHSNLLHSVRKVTQQNKGRKTPGLDHQRVLTSRGRAQLTRQMEQYQAWKVKPAKRIYIPKAGGKQRPLGILTIKNRVAQAIVKNALEPSWEARFEPNSYGFRPGRSCHDAIQHCWLRFKKSSKNRWALDADLKGAFDNINHDFILDRLGNTPGRELIRQWLKAGYVEAENLHATTSGVQQGGVISPLLANIALDGLQSLLGKAGYIRYADDFLVTANTNEEIQDLVPHVKTFFAERGLVLNTAKTKVVSVIDGFNFLGFNVRTYKGKCIIKPQKDKVLSFLQEIRDWLRCHRTIPVEAVISHLNPILRGWGNFYKHVNSKKIFDYVDHQVWLTIWRWCIRRHPNKSRDWVFRRYFRTVKGRKWIFFCKVRDHRSGELTEIHLTKVSAIPINYHVKVARDASPDDPALQDYWQKRSAKGRYRRD